jgi:hypothetical protein
MAFMVPLMATIGPYLSIASGVIGAVSAISGANAQSASAQSDANAAEYNAQVNRQRAAMALQQGNAQESQQRRNARSEAGYLRAGLVENGMDLSSGTGADLVYESSLNSEMDALNIRYGAQLNAQGANAAAILDDNSAKAAKNRAKQYKVGGYMGAAGSILTGVGGAYQSYQAGRANSLRAA